MHDNKTAENILHWHSRRGLLELDLILNKFWQQKSGTLTVVEMQELRALLACEDDSIWKLIRAPIDDLPAIFNALPSNEQEIWQAHGGNLHGQVLQFLREMRYQDSTIEKL